MSPLKTRLIIDTALAIAALAVSLGAFLYAAVQATATQQQVDLMRKQLEITQTQLADDRSYAAVLAPSTLAELTGPLTHLKKMSLECKNVSSRPQTYRFRIKTTGFGVSLTVDGPAMLDYDLSLEKDHVVVPPKESYKRDFYYQPSAIC